MPSAPRQAQRLTPQFQRLQEAMDNKRLTVQDNPLGLQPEQVVVLETVGQIQGFIKAVEKIPGLEWLGEYEIDDIAPVHGFEMKERRKGIEGTTLSRHDRPAGTKPDAKFVRSLEARPRDGIPG